MGGFLMERLRPLTGGLIIGLIGLAIFIFLPRYLMSSVQEKGEEHLASFPSYESIQNDGDDSFSMRVWETTSGTEKVISYTGSTAICILPQFTVYFVVHPDGTHKAFTNRWYLGRILNGMED